MSSSGTIAGHKVGKLIIEGKTKKVFDLPEKPGYVILESKDRITAGDGVKAHDLEGKAAISTLTTSKVFQLLSNAGIKTHFVEMVGEKAMITKKCEMVPIEWVTRRLATGSFLKRNPGVPEGYRFAPPCQETFFKDDANHDPQWSLEQVINAKFKLGGIEIGATEVAIMKRMTLCVFEVLERAWATRDCVLVDMKIEFGVDDKGEILVADVIDSDSWRLWPSGDKRLMKDKQVYRNLSQVTDADLAQVKDNFKWVADQLGYLLPEPSGRAVVLMGSPTDMEHCKEIQTNCNKLGVPCELRVTSAHKGTLDTLRIAAEYESSSRPLVLIAVAGRSNGLGPVLSGNVACPVINCPPVNPTNVEQDIWSSLNTPSGLGCMTVVYPSAAAQAAATILAISDHVIWAKLRARQLNNAVSLLQADKNLNKNE